jgi:hypothetical protein
LSPRNAEYAKVSREHVSAETGHTSLAAGKAKQIPLFGDVG